MVEHGRVRPQHRAPAQHVARLVEEDYVSAVTLWNGDPRWPVGGSYGSGSTIHLASSPEPRSRGERLFMLSSSSRRRRLSRSFQHRTTTSISPRLPMTSTARPLRPR